VPKPKKPRKKYRAHRFFNRNHIAKSRKYGTRRTLILAREVRVAPEMSAIIGRERASWAEITRLIWVYIKEHKLQNPDNGIFFKPDQQLATIIELKASTWMDSQ
jgi:upstream activation factor subunit UAF30